MSRRNNGGRGVGRGSNATTRTRATTANDVSATRRDVEVARVTRSLTGRLDSLRARMEGIQPVQMRASGRNMSAEAVMARQVREEMIETLEMMETKTRMLVAIRQRQLNMRRRMMDAAERPSTATAMHRFAPATHASMAALRAARSPSGDNGGDGNADAGVLSRGTRSTLVGRRRAASGRGMTPWRRQLFRRTQPPRAPAQAPARRTMTQYLQSVYRTTSSSQQSEQCAGLSQAQIDRLPHTPLCLSSTVVDVSGGDGGGGDRVPATGTTDGVGSGGGGKTGGATRRGNSAKTCETHGSCCICLAVFLHGDVATTLPCLHVFHSSCVKRWLRRKNTCPLCMGVVEV